MPQEMNILCCFSCKMYQVHIVKKAKKWECKICNAKQLLKRVYFQGSGKECRIRVQKLNATKEYENETSTSLALDNDTRYGSCRNDCTKPPRLEIAEKKWTKYLDGSEGIRFSTFETLSIENNNDEENDNSMYPNNTNPTYKRSQTNYATNSSSYRNTLKENYRYNNGKESNNVVEEESCRGNSNDTKRNVTYDNNVTETGVAKNIFDDNEDFDLAINF